MDFDFSMYREPTTEELLQANAVARLERLVKLEESVFEYLVGTLPAEAVLEMLKLETSQAVAQSVVVAEADRLSALKVPSEAELMALDADAWDTLLSSLDKKRKIRVFRRVPIHILATLIERQKIKNMEYEVAVSQAFFCVPTMTELLANEPGIRSGMILVQDDETQILLLNQMPAWAKSEMLMHKYQEAFKYNLKMELDSRDT